MLREFYDSANGGFYFTSSAGQNLLMRSRHLMGGGNIPSPNGIVSIVLIRLGRITGDSRYTQAANHTLDALSGLMWQLPGSFETEILATAVSLESVDTL
jgi:hypothetical protein